MDADPARGLVRGRGHDSLLGARSRPARGGKHKSRPGRGRLRSDSWLVRVLDGAALGEGHHHIQ